MPKPPGTYLQTKQPDRTAARVAAAKALKLKVESDTRRMALAMAFKAANVDPKQLDAMRKIAESCKNFGKEPATRQGVLLKELMRAIKELEKLSEKLSKSTELSAETAKDTRSFVSATRPMHGTAPSPPHVAAGALAVVVFVMSLKNLWARLMK